MPWEAPPQTYLSGDTAGTTHVFGPVVTLQGSNVTLSGSGNKIVIVGAAAATQTVAGSAAISAGTQSVSTGTVKFADSNGVTFGMSGSSQITATVKTDYLTAQSAFVLSASNGLVWGTNASTVTGSYTVPAQTNQTLGLYAVGNTTGESSSSTLDARTVSYKGLGIASVGYSNSSVLVSVPAPAAQTAFVLSNSNGVSWGTNGSTVTATVKTDYLTGQSTQPALNAASAGTASVSGVTLKFADSNGVSWGLNTGANSSVLTATVKTDYLTTARASTDAIGLNTAQTNVTWTVNSSGLSLNAGGYAGTVTGATNASLTANTSGVSVNVPNTAVGTNTAQTNVTWTVNTSGISLNAAGYAGTVTGATNASLTVNSAGVSVNVPQATLSRYFYPAQWASISAMALGQNSLYVAYAQVPFYVTATLCRLFINVGGMSTNTSGTGTAGFSVRFGLYTRNASSLSSASTASQTYSASWTSNGTASLSGFRELTIPINVNMTPGEYWAAFCLSTSTNARNITVSHYAGADMNTGPIYPQSIGAATTTTRYLFPGLGTYSATTGALPNAMSITQISGAGADLAAANFVWDLANYTVNT